MVTVSTIPQTIDGIARNNIKTLIEIYRKDNISEDKIRMHVESILIETGIQFSEKSLEEILK